MTQQTPSREPDQAPADPDVPGQAPHPARDPVPDQPIDPTIPPIRDPGTAPMQPGRNPVG